MSSRRTPTGGGTLTVQDGAATAAGQEVALSSATAPAKAPGATATTPDVRHQLRKHRGAA